MKREEALQAPSPVRYIARRPGMSMLTTLVVLQIMSGFVQGFYTPLLPDIARNVGVSVEAMNWFQTSQAMAAVVLVPLLSRVGDLIGARKVLRISLVVVLVGTLLIALVPSFGVILVGRVLQGPIGVWLPLSIAIVYVRMSEKRSARAITIMAGSLTGGIVIGTVASGLVYALSFKTMVITLLVPVVAVLVGAYGVYFRLPQDVEFGTGRVDWVGFAGLGAVMVAIIYSLGHMGYRHLNFSILLLFITGIVLIAWILWEQRSPNPAVDIRLVTSRSMGPLYLTAFVIGVLSTDVPPNMAAYMSTDPGEFGYGFSSSTQTISLLIAALLVFAMAGAFASSFIAARISMRATLVGASLLGGLGQLAMILAPHTIGAFWCAGILSGFAAGVLSGIIPVLISHAAPEGKTGIANGLYAAFSAVGGAVGGAVFKKILENFRGDVGVSGIGGYLALWGFCVLLFLIAAAALTLVPITREVREEERT